ncbi:MAG: site-specific integrase [Bacteroidales bacterium]|nr:site-specific integrase [Bacteroidales bacterium]
MTSFRVKFRPSTVEGRKGIIYYQIIHQRKVRLYNTTFHIFKAEWDATQKWLRFSPVNPRLQVLMKYSDAIQTDIDKLQRIVNRLDHQELPFTTDDIIEAFRHNFSNTFFNFMKSEIVRLQLLGCHRTAETYEASLSSFRAFLHQRRNAFEHFDAELMQAYETYMRRKGLSPNTTSFYFRTLRAVYNRAVEQGLLLETQPFRHVYTGVAKTEKRAVPLEVVRLIKTSSLDSHPHWQLARDLFLFSFYTRGMSFIDMAYLRKCDLHDGILTYRRRKTNQELRIRWEACMQTIVDRYAQDDDTPYLLPIIRQIGVDERTQYRNALTLVNRHLRKISKLLKFATPISMYVARHSWASIAKSRDIPISIISEGMGHESEKTTRIYLTALDSVRVDTANRKVLEAL